METLIPRSIPKPASKWHVDDVCYLKLTYDGSLLASAGRPIDITRIQPLEQQIQGLDGQILVSFISTGKLLARLQLPKVFPTSLAWVSNKHSHAHLIAGYSDGKVAIWNLSSRACPEPQPVSENSSPVIEMSYDPISSNLVVATEYLLNVMQFQKELGILDRSTRSRKFATAIGGMGRLKSGSQIIVSFPEEKKM
jgi:WD40 repeat protein